MLEKIKSIPFIDESRAVKVEVAGGLLRLERTDKVLWGAEELRKEGWEDVPVCYVEADKFFALLPNLAALRNSGAHLEATLVNGAKYLLPFLDVSWQGINMPADYDQSITFKLTDLTISTLTNLIKPEFQCIRIDPKGAVSCDFVSSCISRSMKAERGFLLPPELQPLVDGRLCKVKVTEDKIYVRTTDFDLVTPNPESSGQEWWEELRQMLPDDAPYVNWNPEALKRLMLFGDYLEFKDGKVYCGDNYEPFSEFQGVPGRRYEADKLLSIMSVATKLASYNDNLLVKNEDSVFLLSPVDEA